MKIDMSEETRFSVEYCRGDDFSTQFTVKDGNGDPVDITGYSFTMSVDQRLNPNDVSTGMFSVAGVIEDGPAGKVSFSPTSSDTDIEPLTYYYDIEMVDAASKKRTIVKSRFTIIQDITK